MACRQRELRQNYIWYVACAHVVFAVWLVWMFTVVMEVCGCVQSVHYVDAMVCCGWFCDCGKLSLSKSVHKPYSEM